MSAVFLMRDPRALLVAVFATVVVLVVPRLIPGWDTIDDLIISVILASVAVYGFTQLVLRNRQLQLAQDEVAVLAVERERERIARDMHDILGHSLTVIAVKAELAGKLFDVDADRARAEIAEVQALARTALADVRGMVTATREVTLAGELAGARQAFDAAGVEAEVPGTIDEVPDDAARAVRVGAARGDDERAAALGRHAGPRHDDPRHAHGRRRRLRPGGRRRRPGQRPDRPDRARPRGPRPRHGVRQPARRLPPARHHEGRAR